MKERISYPQLTKLQPAISINLIALGQAVAQIIEHSLIHLVKLRVSQINGCAFCQHMHVNEARRDGERQSRLDLLPVWKEVPIFTPRERAALAWAEKLTLISNQGIDDEDFADVREQFNEEELVNLTAVIATINAWNRIGGGLHFIPAV